MLFATVWEHIPTRPEPGQEAKRAFWKAVKAFDGIAVCCVPLSTMVPGKGLLKAETKAVGVFELVYAVKLAVKEVILMV